MHKTPQPRLLTTTPWWVSACLLLGALGLSACGSEVEEIGEENAGTHVGFEPYSSEIHYIHDRATALVLSEEGEAGVIRVNSDAPFRHLHLSALMEDGGELQWRVIHEDQPVTPWTDLLGEEEGDTSRFVEQGTGGEASAIELRGDLSLLDFARMELTNFAGDHPPHEEGLDGELPETPSDEIVSAVAKSGRWIPPKSVLAIADTQSIPYTTPPTRCYGSTRPGTRHFAEFLRKGFKTGATWYGYGCRKNTARPGQYSVHASGRAIDLVIPYWRGQADNTKGDAIAHYLITNAKRLGIENVIWDRSAWTAAKSRGNKFRYYTGPIPHYDHLHIELSPAAAASASTYPSIGGSVAPPAPAPKPVRPSMDFQVRWVKASNYFQSKRSKSIADAFEGQKFTAEIILKNQSDRDLNNVSLGTWIEGTYLLATSYRIETDWPRKDRATWQLSSANSERANPPRNGLNGGNRRLFMHKFTPGESKRVVIDFVGGRDSLGRVPHPDLRSWLWHVDGLYGNPATFHSTAATNAYGRTIRDFAQIDILGRDEWSFRGWVDSDLSGWNSPSSHIDVLKFNPRENAMAIHVTGSNPYVSSPFWTAIDATTYDQMVLVSRSHDGPQTTDILFHHGDRFTAADRVRFGTLGDGNYHTYVVPMGSHSAWRGTVRGIRYDPTLRAPTQGESGWFDVRAIYFQSSRTKKTSSPYYNFAANTPVTLQPL